jgi:hypothetical protein
MTTPITPRKSRIHYSHFERKVLSISFLFATILVPAILPDFISHTNNGMNPIVKDIQNPSEASVPPFYEPLAIDTTETIFYNASILPAWRTRASHVGNVNIGGFVGNNGIRPAYNTYNVTMQPNAVVDHAGNEEFGSVAGTGSPDGSYHSYKETSGPDSAWATWSLNRRQSTSAAYTRLDSRRVPAAPTFTYIRNYQSWWDTDGNIFNGAEANGGYLALESAFFIGSRAGDIPYQSATKSYYIRDTGSINTPLHSNNVPLAGWDWTWDKDAPLFDGSGTGSRTACLWQRTFSDTLSYPQIVNDFAVIRATMVASCTINETISIDLGIAPGWQLAKAELSLDSFWHPAGVGLHSGTGISSQSIVSAV